MVQTLSLLLLVVHLTAVSVHAQSTANPGDEVAPSEEDTETTTGTIPLTPILETGFLVFIGLMVALYTIQIRNCWNLATPGVWGDMWRDTEQHIGVWLFLVVVFFLPLVFGIAPEVLMLAHDATDRVLYFARLQYGAYIATLTVLVTVEFTYLADLPDSVPWQRLLFVALTLDVVTLFALTAGYWIFDPIDRESLGGLLTQVSLNGIILFALITSVFVVTCVRHVKNAEARKHRDAWLQAEKKREREATHDRA